MRPIVITLCTPGAYSPGSDGAHQDDAGDGDHDGAAVGPGEACFRAMQCTGAHERPRDVRHIVAGFERQELAVHQPVFEISGAVIVGGEHHRKAVGQKQPMQEGGAGEDVVVRVLRIRPKPVGRAHVGISLRHELHDAERPGARGDRHGLGRHGAPATLRHDDGADPGLGYVEALGRIGDQRVPTAEKLARRHLLFERVGRGRRLDLLGRLRLGQDLRRYLGRDTRGRWRSAWRAAPCDESHNGQAEKRDHRYGQPQGP